MSALPTCFPDRRLGGIFFFEILSQGWIGSREGPWEEAKTLGPQEMRSLFILLSNLSQFCSLFSLTLKPYMLHSTNSHMPQNKLNERVYSKQGIWVRAGVCVLPLALSLASCVMSGNLSDPLSPLQDSGSDDVHEEGVVIS